MFSKLCMIAVLLVAALSVVSAHWYQSYVTPYVTGYGGGMYYGGDSDGFYGSDDYYYGGGGYSPYYNGWD